MLIVKVGAFKYGIVWEHFQDATKCSIFFLNDRTGEKREDAIAWAYLHPNDKYCRETGRKKSLEKALAFKSREERGLFWNAYFARKQKAA